MDKFRLVAQGRPFEKNPSGNTKQNVKIRKLHQKKSDALILDAITRRHTLPSAPDLIT